MLSQRAMCPFRLIAVAMAGGLEAPSGPCADSQSVRRMVARLAARGAICQANEEPAPTHRAKKRSLGRSSALPGTWRTPTSCAGSMCASGGWLCRTGPNSQTVWISIYQSMIQAMIQPTIAPTTPPYRAPIKIDVGIVASATLDPYHAPTRHPIVPIRIRNPLISARRKSSRVFRVAGTCRAREPDLGHHPTVGPVCSGHSAAGPFQRTVDSAGQQSPAFAIATAATEPVLVTE